jgi:hypothetical protein
MFADGRDLVSVALERDAPARSPLELGSVGGMVRFVSGTIPAWQPLRYRSLACRPLAATSPAAPCLRLPAQDQKASAVLLSSARRRCEVTGECGTREGPTTTDP